MKKLLMILLLVLILILSTVSIFAQQDVRLLAIEGVDLPCSLSFCTCDPSKLVNLTSLQKGIIGYPVWFATESEAVVKAAEPWCNPCGGEGVFVQKSGTLTFLNQYPHVVYASIAAATPTMIIEQALADSGLAATMKIPSLKIDNIYNVAVTLEIPRSWAQGYGVYNFLKMNACNQWVFDTANAAQTFPLQLNGYVAVLEDIYTKVTITHHIQREGKPEIQIAEIKDATWLANDILKPERVPAEWAITYIKDISYRPELTTVAKAMAGSVLIDGEQHQVGWKVDMFYTQAKAEGKGTGAAKGSNKIVLANLPSTGAANHPTLVLVSVAAMLLGAFLKK